MRASEMGWTKEQFDNSTQRLFLFTWTGYVRRIERTSYSASREIVAIVRNVNSKKGKQKPAHKIFPLSIDFIQEFTYEDASVQYEKMKNAGWLN